MLPIVDTHQHLWDLDVFDLDWLDELSHDRLTRNFDLKDYVSASEGCHIMKTIYMEVDVRPEQHLLEAEYVLELCRRDDNQMVGAVLGGRPAANDFGDYVRRFRDEPLVKGIRQVLYGLPPEFCLQDDFIAGVRLLGDQGLSFDIEAPAEQLEITAKLCDTCPDTRFILDHCAHPQFESNDITAWQKCVAQVARRENVLIKISGILAHANSQDWQVERLAFPVNFLLDTFGPDRAIFGSDWPVVTVNGSLKRWVNAVMEVVAERPEEEQQRLFHDNAIRVYGL